MAQERTDIEEMVETWAWECFHKSHAKVKLEDYSISVNWDKLKTIADKPQYKKNAQGYSQNDSQVVYRSTFLNNLGTEQQHSFNIERTTTAVATTSITKGYTKGVSLGLSLSVPGDVASATVGFGYETHVDNVEESMQEKSMTWCSQGTVSVPPRKKVAVEMKVTEEKLNFSFKTLVKMMGKVVATIRTRKENEIVMVVEGNIADIVRGKSPKSATILGRTVVWEIEGLSTFRFGVQQNTEVKEE
ncbi:hypothetical protein CHS0354_030452 [Potamilus streckersoni]|uniref:Uncharacterized protein n=1 Tax=Potamilus streckersoni TaxID=2493646 RepID=A0AAE0T244_9BIVA|nr:hypothetical protein CHS0354_030452 [Potamilus streckersoni]